MCASVGEAPSNLISNIKRGLLSVFSGEQLSAYRGEHIHKTRDNTCDSNTARQHGTRRDGESHRDTIRGLDFASSHRGMFLGFLCLAGSFIAIIMYFSEVSSDSSDDYIHAQLCYLITDISFELLCIMASFMALYTMRNLSLKAIHLDVDDILLLIAMAGSYLFEISMIVSNAYYLAHTKDKGDDDNEDKYDDIESDENSNETLIILSLVLSLLAFIQITAQTILVITGRRRFTSPAQYTEKKPGRGAITFLVVTNVTLWIFGVVQIKNMELGIQEDFYGLLAWLFILNINLPLYLFYRFHSSVCLADIWTHAYRCEGHVPSKTQPKSVVVANPTFEQEE